MRGGSVVKRRGLRRMILTTKGMIFRKKYGGDNEPTNTRTHKSFFSKKSQSLIFRRKMMLISLIYRTLQRMGLL